MGNTQDISGPEEASVRPKITVPNPAQPEPSRAEVQPEHYNQVQTYV